MSTALHAGETRQAPSEGETATGANADGDADAERKRFEHVRALLALRQGHVVHELTAGGYLVCWRGLSRECRDLVELEAHACRVGAMQ